MVNNINFFFINTGFQEMFDMIKKIHSNKNKGENQHISV